MNTICIKDGGPIIAVEVRGWYDGTAYYQCDKCRQVWSRDGRALTSTAEAPHPTAPLRKLGEWKGIT